MVLGAPRQALARLRPNLLAASELDSFNPGIKRGYYGASFVPESARVHNGDIHALDGPVVRVVGPSSTPMS